MGVNDLIDQWKAYSEWCKGRGKADALDYQAGIGTGTANCRNELKQASRTAWHPVSEPPTEADGHFDHVMAYDPKNGELTATTVDSIQCGDILSGYWARIHDVVLLPME